MEVQSKPFRLDDLVVETARDLGEGILVEVEPVVVSADRGRVQQMLTNYLNNATRYGRAPITARVEVVEDHVQVTVVDHGEGVSDELADNLFSKFAAGRAPDGTGLGLFIVKQLAQLQGGDAWYETTPRGGASFGFRLPLVGLD